MVHVEAIGGQTRFLGSSNHERTQRYLLAELRRLGLEPRVQRTAVVNRFSEDLDPSAGTVTNICCESSARDAAELDYKVILASDALAGHAHGLHEATLSTFYRIFGDVRPSDEIIALLRTSERRQPPVIAAGA